MEESLLCQWSVIRSLLAILQWWSFNVTVIVLNKWIFQKHDFKFPLTISCIHFICSGAILVIKELKLANCVNSSTKDTIYWDECQRLLTDFLGTYYEIIGEISVAGTTYKVMEFVSSIVESLSMEERMTLCNMVVEAGGKNGIVSTDSTIYNLFFKSIILDTQNLRISLHNMDSFCGKLKEAIRLVIVVSLLLGIPLKNQVDRTTKLVNVGIPNKLLEYLDEV
ncbi:hypothetical protein G4B88_005572 [Cannabis sativa]|uniref:Aconitase/3-isopropylmalate dehydratase large subunit alpha/beta/alpha domain-containing protein n=1 Tax=Cannabis sativa TaxID=3483 RepID=A0A7J6H8T4_CANSA|nr:hypothetical protein G4B88_005572 [Cannabis sativa]